MSPAEFAALALHGNVRHLDSVEPIKHGLTNESWLVTLDGKQVVVRISNPDDASLQIDRQSETSILRAVAAAGIGPLVLLCDPSQRVLVTRYLGPTWTDDDAVKPDNIARLGLVMRKLHVLAPPSDAHRVRLVQVIDDYVATLSQAADSEARYSAQVLDDAADTCLCHNDVHALNIVDDGDLRLIDWEYAGLGSPLFDLASVCVYQRYDGEQRAHLLAAYAGNVEAQRLDRACDLFAYIRELWMTVRRRGSGQDVILA
jgi:thiamine kinase